MKKDEGKVLKWYYIVAIFATLIFVYFYGTWNTNVKEPEIIFINYGITTGRLVSFERKIYNTIISAKYEFIVNGEKYRVGLKSLNPCRHEAKTARNEILEVRYPVIYSNNNPKISRLLIRPEDFAMFDMEFPDSLTTIYLKYWNCR